jgi:hypothetical protein
MDILIQIFERDFISEFPINKASLMSYERLNIIKIRNFLFGSETAERSLTNIIIKQMIRLFTLPFLFFI